MNLTPTLTATFLDQAILATSRARAILVMGVFLTLFTYHSDSAQGAPQLTVKEGSVDFGIVPARSKVSHRYWLHSTGSTPLEIEWTDASCPCAHMPLSATLIQPGDSVAFELILETGRMSGGVERRPYIKTNADSEPTRTHFIGSVVLDSKLSTPLGFTPFRADLSQFGDHFRDTAKLKFQNSSEHTFRSFEVVETRPEFFEVSFPDSLAAGSSATVVITLNPSARDLSFESSITFDILSRPVGADNFRTRYTIPIRRILGGK